MTSKKSSMVAVSALVHLCSGGNAFAFSSAATGASSLASNVAEAGGTSTSAGAGSTTSVDGIAVPREMMLRIAAPDAANFLAGEEATPVLREAFSMLRQEASFSSSVANEASDQDLARRIVLEVAEQK